MKRLTYLIFLTVLLASFIVSCSDNEETSTAMNPVDYYSTHVGKVLKTYKDGILAEVETSYGPLYVLRLKGSHYEMGYQYGYLAADKIAGTWWSFARYIAPSLGMDVQTASAVFGMILDMAWLQMAPYVPQEFYEEMRGIDDGAKAAGFKNEYTIDGETYSDETSFSTIVERIVAISNISDLLEEDPTGDMGFVLKTGFSPRAMDFYGIQPEAGSPPALRLLQQKLKELGVSRVNLKDIFGHCSFFAAWNFRTEDGHMIASRNLDWNENTGIADFKALTVWMPDGEIPHVTIGYIGFIGALAGISEAGITVSEVGSTSVFERLKGEPWVLKFREILGKAHNMDEALNFVLNKVGDGFNRPPTIGYNWLITYGDPMGNGKNAEAANIENNGVFIGVYRRHSDCTVDATLYQFGVTGYVEKTITHSEDPWLANYEKDAYEVMLKDVRSDSPFPPYPYSLTDTPTKDIISLKKPVEGTSTGYRFSVDGVYRNVGRELSCAVYRGDEMMMHGMRMWQSACHGPWRHNSDDNTYYQDLERLMLEGSSYNKRYLRMYTAIQDYAIGKQLIAIDDFDDKPFEVVPDNNGLPLKINLDYGTRIARWAAMTSNIFSVVYDSTALEIMVAFEQISDDKWIRASNNEYKYINLRDLFYGK